MKAQTSNPEEKRLVMDRLEARSDAELLELSMAGEEGAFLLLYERLKPSLFRYAFYMTNSKAAAEEVTQEVFISLLKDGRRYRKARGDVAGYAFGIARNFVRRIQRRERIYEELPSDEALAERPTLGPHVLQTDMIRAQEVAMVHKAVASLPDHYRQLIVLCDLCELSYAEAASRLQCAVGTVRSRLNRARALLLVKLKQSRKPQTESSTAGTEECLI